jgi:protoheme IX farnesyltransferase
MIFRLSRLFRLPLALMNGVAAVGGYCLFPAPRNGWTMLIACGGVTLLTMGGTALNQVLDRDIDALMSRTRLRPLPRSEMTPAVATAIGCGVIMAGSALLFTAGGLVPVLLGMAALAWYLAVYTPLKRRTPLALLLGALCGAVPPLVGWNLAGGDPTDFRIITLAGLFFVWQIPHFWLLQKRHADDYRRAGIPLFAIRPGLFGLWLVALTATALMLPVFGIIGNHAAYWYGFSLILLLAMGLIRCERPLFPYLNLFPVLVTLTLLIQGCSQDESRKDAVAPSASTTAAQGASRDGEALFRQYCAACHPDGGNVSDPQRTLYGSVLKKNHISTPDDIVRIMRKPLSRMIRFDPSVLSDRDARLIAEYVLKTFR